MGSGEEDGVGEDDLQGSPGKPHHQFNDQVFATKDSGFSVIDNSRIFLKKREMIMIPLLV